MPLGKMVGKHKYLGEVCQFSNGLWKGEKPPFVNVGVIRNTNFTKEGTLDDSDIAYLDVEAKKLEKRRLQFGDIILEKSGGGPKQPVGRVALFDKEDGDFSFSNFTAALRVLDPRELDFRFLHKFLHWTYLSGITEGMQSHSTGIRNLDGDAYKAIKISFPPPPEQQRIVGPEVRVSSVPMCEALPSPVSHLWQATLRVSGETGRTLSGLWPATMRLQEKSEGQAG